MAPGDGAGDAHRHPARGPLLLPAAELFWRKARRPGVRNGDDDTSGFEPAAARGDTFGCALAAVKYVRRGVDWKTRVDKYDRPHTLFYLDPPYFEAEGYGVPFPFSEYEAMAQRLRTIKGRAIVSLNDHPEIRWVFDGFHIETVNIKYTVGGGLREAARKEVIIFSWDEAAEPAGLF